MKERHERSREMLKNFFFNPLTVGLTSMFLTACLFDVATDGRLDGKISYPYESYRK